MRRSQVKVIIVNESTKNSIIADSYTFGGLLVSFFVNYNYLGNSTIIILLISFMMFIFTLNRGLSKVKNMTPGEALIYLRENEESNAKQPKEVAENDG
jgi:hypothetical protein